MDTGRRGDPTGRGEAPQPVAAPRHNPGVNRTTLPAAPAVAVRFDRGLTSLPPLSLYLHLPWCLKKCPYCDFNSHEWRGAAGAGSPLASFTGSAFADAEREYVAALQADLEASLPQVWGRSVQTVFIGGGTPSLFSPAAIDALLTMVRARLPLAAQAEVTMEANPGTFEAQRFRDYAAAGVNRLSIGVQSFDDRLLAAVGRVHDGDQARRAIEVAARHYESFNIDLMYALPGQRPEDLQHDLDTALSFEPPHLSCYHLTLEPNTLFAARPPAGLPDEDAAADLQDRVDATLASAGLAHYEVSAWARRGRRARHNLNYWQFGDYLGLGAGAHGKLSYHDRIERYVRHRHPRRYVEAALAGNATEHKRRLTSADLPFEFMLNVLRLIDGVPAALFAERTGLSAAAMSRPMARALERGLIDPDPATIRPTALGLRFLNDLQAMFLPADGTPAP